MPGIPSCIPSIRISPNRCAATVPPAGSWALDGGALVLAAMSAGPDTRVCVIGRGPSGGLADHLERFRRFSGLEADHIAAGIKGFHHPAGRRIVAHETRAVLGFRADRPDAGHHRVHPDRPRLGREFRGHHRCRVRP